MIKVLLLIAVVAIGLLLVPGLNFEANASLQQSSVTSETSHNHPSNFMGQHINSIPGLKNTNVKKNILSLIRIVTGLTFVIPKHNTGFSLAQNGVPFVAIQDVGLANQIKNKIDSQISMKNR